VTEWVRSRDGRGRCAVGAATRKVVAAVPRKPQISLILAAAEIPIRNSRSYSYFMQILVDLMQIFKGSTTKPTKQ